MRPRTPSLAALFILASCAPATARDDATPQYALASTSTTDASASDTTIASSGATSSSLSAPSATGAESASVDADDPCKRPWPTFAPAGARAAAGPAPTPPAPRPDAPSSAVGGGVGDASAVIATMAGGFKRCYQRVLTCEDPPATVRARLKLQLDAAGLVLNVEHLVPLESQGFAKCLEDVTRSKAFSPPEGGGATVVVPLTFARAEGTPDPEPAPAGP